MRADRSCRRRSGRDGGRGDEFVVSARRQHGKAFPLVALGQSLRSRFAHVDGFDPGAGRPAAASLDHALDRGRGPGEHGLDAAVAAISDPTLEAMQTGMMLDPHAKADALYAAAEDHAPNDLFAHPASPTSAARVPKGWPQRSSDCT